MSQSGSQAAAFFREVARNRVVWFVRDDAGSPAPITSDGKRAAPYWSTFARAQRAAEIWGHGLRAESMSLEQWQSTELPDLAGDELLVGINWTGARLVGWQFTVGEVRNRLAVALTEPPNGDDGSPPCRLRLKTGAGPESLAQARTGEDGQVDLRPPLDPVLVDHEVGVADPPDSRR
ncbi:DUF2750 domain-containing protein [Micromonospora sp. NBS 11-29]|uniref:DUF2750 domain-containing protein n=1 Tax=Micromonospora sp. NBS 11-29 TaxID=1960879 RepID=UPI000B7976CE|nr:DUF2750 domain-containing protein [Micromonospora sp. NBS 11-29]